MRPIRVCPNCRSKLTLYKERFSMEDRGDGGYLVIVRLRCTECHCSTTIEVVKPTMYRAGKFLNSIP